MIGTLLALTLATVSETAVEYDCQTEKQLLMRSDKGKWAYSAIDVARQDRETFRYKFSVINDTDGRRSVTHKPGILDAIGLGGTYEATNIAQGQFAFATQKASNCLFTELACGALVEISDIDDKRASFSVTPMGSVKMEDGRREIMQMVMLGTCKKSKS
jgi:hypothetical protein